MHRAIAALQSIGSIRREERVIAGRVGGLVWVIASVSVIALALVMPGTHRTALLAMGAAGCGWGLFSGLRLNPGRLPVWLIHVSAAVGTAAIAVAISLSGGAASPAWACLFYVVVFAAYFFTPPVAAGYFIACVAVEAIVVLASSPAARAQGTAKAVVAAPAFIVVGSALIAGKRFMLGLRGRAERLAAEQSALRRVATSVVSGEPVERFYRLVAVEAARLIGGSGAGILRLGAGEATVLGSWASRPEREYAVGDSLAVRPESDVASALSAGRAAQVSETPDILLGRLGAGSSIVAPIRVGGRTWGFLAVVAGRPGALASDQVRRLNEFAELIAISVASIEDRAALAAQAATDPLTGVGNHRTFHQRLGADLARARRYGSPVSVALIDVDHFKLVNDTSGHEAGDELLKQVARCLSDATRAEDTLARVGGDEFAWILPETTADEALAAVERARHSISGCAEVPDAEPRMTISAGVCDSRWTSDPAELVRLADRALYLSKEHGRNQVSVYAVDTDALAGAPPVR